MEPKIYKPSIYKGAGIYKAGAGGGEIPLHESILQYANDWQTTNSDWVLGPNTTCKVRMTGMPPQTVNLNDAFDFLLSKEIKILYVKNKLMDVAGIVFDNPINDDYWHPLARYVGSDFETFFMGDAHNPILTDYFYPIDVNRGIKLFQYYNSDLNSSPNFGTIAYTGSLNNIPNSGISIKMAIKTDDTPISFPLDGLTFKVVLK